MYIFYLKFYCELNYIESYWAEAKRYSRLNCNYTFKDLKEVVLRALDSVSLTKICQFSCRSTHYISIYELGLSDKAAVFAVKRYWSHRHVPANVLEEFGEM